MLKTLQGEANNKVPVWLMRQAGRYLPEYREVRKNFRSFIDFCLHESAAAEVTIQPLERFDLSAAIIFSDILIIPHALGIKVEFKEGEGPVLDPLDSEIKINSLNNFNEEVFYQVGKALKLVKSELNINFPTKNLIGFAGGPFTVASYMIEGRSTKDFKKTLKLAYAREDLFQKIIDVIVSATIGYLIIQIESGAEIIKIFDSWSGVLSHQLFDKWVIDPTIKIISGVKKVYPNVPIIGFPRSSGIKIKKYSKIQGLSGLAIDQYTPMTWAKNNIQNICLQGNLDNLLLAYGSASEIIKETNHLLKVMKNNNFIFNLGHGVIPETPIDNVKVLVDTVNEFLR